MAIFGNLELEEIVQENDKTRLDATKSFVSKDEAAITLVEIEPEASAGFIDVTGTSFRDWFLDWEYSTDGTKTVSVRITTDGAPVTSTATMDVITAADDKLFSGDQDITALEPDILQWIRPGRNTFLDVHRKAQVLILDWINDLGVRNNDLTRVSKDEIVDTEEVRKWSENLVLRLIFEGISNAVDDTFARKAAVYAAREAEAKNRAKIRFDADKDGVAESGEFVPFKTMDLFRR